MKDNEVLRAIRARRSVTRFRDDPVPDEEVEAVLEAGRWAPSYINSQPLEFVVVRDRALRQRIGEILSRITTSWKGFETAPVVIVVAGDPARDPRHLAEDGAAAMQNMALAAQSLGLAGCWAGLHADRETRGTPESDLRSALEIPAGVRLIAALPLGHAAYKAQSTRRSLAEIVHRERY